MPATPAPRRLSRATLATLAALTLAACSDSTGPNDRVPDPVMLEDAAYTIAAELATTLESMDPDFMMQTPTMALLADRTMRGRDARAIAARLASAVEPCGTYTPDVPVDTDEDGIPNELTVTYTLPACHTEDEFGSVDITGSMHLEDDTPTVAGMSFSLAMSAVEVAVHDVEFGSMRVRQDGTGSVQHTASQLVQLHDFSTTIQSDDISARFSTEWDLDFDAAVGSSIVAGEPLPDGTYTPSGKTVIEQMRDRYTFAVSAPTPLSYSAACAADPFTYDNPFTAGVLRVEADGNAGAGWVEVEFSGCAEPTVTYFGSNAD